MKLLSWTAIALALICAGAPATAADDLAITRLAACQDSWLDWQKTAPAALKTFVDRFNADFRHHGNDAFAIPRKEISVAGLRVLQAYPQSVGMGVGFSLTLDADFDKARKAFEAMLGKPLVKCEASDGMHSCERDIAAQRTFMLMAADNDAHQTLAGCYYLYEK